MDSFEAAKAQFIEGLEHLQREDWAQAETCLRASLRLLPDRLSTLNNLAVALIRQDAYEEAEAVIARVLAIEPATAEAWINRGLLRKAQQDFDTALASFDQAIAVDPANADAWSNRGVVLHELGRDEDAIASYQGAIERQPQHHEAWTNQGVAYDALDRLDEALACHQRAIALKPDYHQAWCNMGTALAALSRHEEAIASYERALALRPDFAQAHGNKALALAEMGQDAAALASYERAIALDPDDAVAHWNQGLVHLKLENYRAGWEQFEYRWQNPEMNLKRIHTVRPVWQAQPSRQALLLWGEQGLGDQVLFGSILPELAPLPQKTYVALDQRLIPLFARSMPNFIFVDLDQVNDDLDFAEQLPMGSLPRHFRASRDDFEIARHPYLLADPLRSTELRRQLQRQGRLVCGLAWSSQRKKLGVHKSMSLEQLVTPLASAGLHFVNLQYGDTAAEREAVLAKHGIAVQNVDDVNLYDDLDGLAALIQACDVVITTSNTTAHVAGALGKETLLLLPFGRGRLWYWAGPANSSRWYPSVRMFTQERPGQWQTAIEKINTYLENKTWN